MLCLAVPRQAQAHRDATAGAATIASIHMVDLRIGWAVAAVGTATDAIVRTTDGGRAWSLLHPSIVPPLPGEGRHLQVPLTRVSDLSFVDALHGWTLGISCRATDGTCSLVLRATNDGGRTWRALPAPTTAPAYRGDAGNTVHVGSIRFADVHDGWAFGPGLYATRDGGRTWSPDRRIGAVVARAARGRSVWAISSTCPALSGTPAARCRLTLFVSDDVGRTWQQDSTGTLLHDAQAQIIRADAADGWIRAWSDVVAQHTTLLETHDKGVTWHIVARPVRPSWVQRLHPPGSTQRL